MRAPACLLWIIFAAAAHAGESSPAPRPSASVDIELHRTSNALDNDLALADSFAKLRGSIGHVFALENGHLKLSAEAEASAYRTYDLEDDRRAGAQIERLVKLSPRLELRGTLTYAILDEGDDVRIGPAALGIRTLTRTTGAGLEAGIDLGSGWTLVLAGSQAFERSGATRFAGDLLPATRLEPDRDRTRLSASLRAKRGAHLVAAGTDVELLEAEVIGDPPLARSYAGWRLRGEYGYEAASGLRLSIGWGVHWLRDSEGLYETVRPVYSAALTLPLWRRLEAKAGLGGGFEMVDTDDPLGSYVDRGEVELRMALSERLAVGSGLFLESKQNLLLENDERSWGTYAEIGYAVSPKLRAILRLDHSRTRITILDTIERTTAVFLKLSSTL